MRRWATVLVLAAAVLVGGCGGGKDEATVTACQRAQTAFMATPASKSQLIAARFDAVEQACGAGSAQVARDSAMLGREAEVDRLARRAGIVEPAESGR